MVRTKVSTSKEEWKDEYYKKFPDKWGSKKEFETVKHWMDRYQKMTDAQENGCPIPPPMGGNVGTSWKVFWDQSIKLYMRYREWVEGRSNVKSATIFAPIEAYMSEFQEVNNTVTMTATNEKEKSNVRLHSFIHQAWEAKNDIQKAKNQTARSAAIFGTSFAFVGWRKIIKERNIILTGKKTEREAQEIVEKGDETSLEKIFKETKPLVKKEEVVIYDDAVYIPVSIYEIFIDPDARCIEGQSYPAKDIIWEQVMSIEQFRDEFKHTVDPWLIRENIDKVHGASQSISSYGNTMPFYQPPHTVEDDNKVRVKRCFDTFNDHYDIIANDVCIRRGPLPYNHNGEKKLPFVRHVFYPIEEQLYGQGFPSVLSDVAAEIDTHRNLHLDQEKINANPPVFIKSDIFEDIDAGYDFIKPGTKVEVGGDVGPGSVRWFEGSQYRADFYQTQSMLENESVKLTQMNPMSYAMPKAGEPVRNNMMSLESSLKGIKKLIRNWADGYKDAVWQCVMNRIQFMPEKYLDTYAKGANVIPIDGYKFNIVERPEVDKEGKPVLEKGKPKMESIMTEEKIDGTSYLNNITEEMLQITDIDMRIDSDALAPISQGLKIQNTEKAFNMFMPIFTNPQLRKDPFVVAMIHQVAEVNGFDESITALLDEESTEQQVQYAVEQEKMIERGQEVLGNPGESFVHKYHHSMTLIKALAELQTMDPMMTPPVKLEKLNNFISLLSKHLVTDDMPKDAAIGASLDMANPQPQQSAPPSTQGGVPGEPPMPPEMSMAAGGSPDMMGMAAQGGAPQAPMM